MSITSSGLPIHTRSLSVTVRHASPDEAAFDGYVLDLRKRGVIPVAGDLQSTGIIHHMGLEGSVDRLHRSYRRVEARMPTVAFEASKRTGGESCRDRIGRVAGLSAVSLDASHARAVGAEIGGVQGCSHILTLAQLCGPTIAWALDAQPEDTPDPGERIFRRDVTVDGFVEGDVLSLLAQLNDVHLNPARSCTLTTDRLAGQTEVRVRADLSLSTMKASNVLLEVRRRSIETLETAPWVDRPERAALLHGQSFASGISARLVDGFGNPGPDRPILDALLMLAPATIQCLASYRDSWTQLGQSKLAETGGHANSCYMWRTDGALQERRPGTTND